MRLLFISFAGGGGGLLLECLLAGFMPIFGVIFWIPTLVELSILEEDLGLPTLQDSPDGWPKATTLGEIIAIITWWFIWSVVVAIILWRKRHKNKKSAYTP